MVKIYRPKIGVVQGRLVPPVGGKIQAFPKQDWEREILLIKKAGFDGVEWVFDGEENPLWSEEGRRRIQDLISKYRLEIPSVSGDYLMFNPIFGKTKEKSVKILKELIVQCGDMGIPRINVPLEDQSELNNSGDVADALESLGQCLPLAKTHQVILTTESSLPPLNFFAFMKKVNHPNFKVNYDLGNSCACGYPTDFALQLLKKYLFSIHIKDRTELYGMTVPLGMGDTDFASNLATLKEINYKGWFIIQGARGVNDFETAKRYLAFVRTLLKNW